MEIPQITTDRLTITIPSIEEAPSVVKYVVENRDFHKPWDPPRKESYFTLEYWQNTLEQHRREFLNDQSAKFFIFTREEKQIVGHCNFSCFVRGCSHCANLGFSLAEKAQGNGFMYEALQAAIEYVFEELRLHRIQSNHLPHNYRSRNVLRRLGFVTEGYARDYLFIHNGWQDHVLNSLTNHNITSI
ncbi:GNAT family N-acetyltransferase [Candidatus Uabimicrobium amorphum]|uniref:Ribosomal protein S5 alanineN-acetyltransferase n=1 Tax=Uabimicrobium amorphum TaxID=2596890 RepID=A0A5S9IS81_UABAM|nr:GNAT family N-acetyltransferase [Candidatus Uabimicrobium amorphum]BBM86471.1 ribosomal protein S5 alanineN-acetyltransferase [Candidatus Uabimicrobium amorphum]